jgi:hypothetical protein
MHDCQKPSDMLIGCVIISLEQSLDSASPPPPKAVMACIPSYLFHLPGTSDEMLLFVRLEGWLYSLNPYG